MKGQIYRGKIIVHILFPHADKEHRKRKRRESGANEAREKAAREERQHQNPIKRVYGAANGCMAKKGTAW